MGVERLVGPILYIGLCDQTNWRFSLGLLLGGSDAGNPPPLKITFEQAQVSVGAPIVAWDFTRIGRGVLWRWPIQAKRDSTERRLSYRLEPEGEPVKGVDPNVTFGQVAVPARGELPRLAFFSCNGVLHWQPLEEDLHQLWWQILTRHQRAGQLPGPDQPSGFHLLVGGGDQIYADVLWDERGDVQVPELVGYATPSNKRIEGANTTYPAAVADRLRRAYVDLYIRRWSPGRQDNPFAHALAAIPGVFVWDDHDIFDGWGSHPPARQATDLFKKAYTAAREAYTAFQLGGADRPNHTAAADTPFALQAVRFRERDEELSVLLLDLRAERVFDSQRRERNQVISPGQWGEISKWLTAHAQDGGKRRRHLVVVSSVPVFYMRFTPFEERIAGLRGGDDDARDQWSSEWHKGERNRLIMNLLAHQRAGACQVTLLAGDVHVGARAAIRSRNPEHLRDGQQQAVIYQAISSAVVHPPPGALEFFVARLAGRERTEPIGHLVEAAMQEIDREEYLRVRNWLSIGFDRKTGADQTNRTRLWAQWNTSQGPVSEQVIIETEA